MEGKFDADIHFDGKFPKLNTAGTIFLSEGGVDVDYLKTRYTYKATTVPVNNQLFDLTGGVLYDKYKHTAQITGGVSHDYLKKFGFKAKLSSKRFLCLDTQKGDNPTFYGQAIGTGDIVFSGSFKLPDIYVKASVSDSTRVIIPISSEIATQNIKNVRFVNKQKEGLASVTIKSKPILKGLSFDMDLEAKSGAVLEMVFNEQTGDILKVTGRGGVRLSVMRNEPFKMFGDISIDDGSYLFTYLAINKNFRLRPRGTISWNGDPYKASINIEASYDDINASTSLLIQEYLTTANQNIKSEASQNTPVTLILKLQGDLFKPKITFDIAFPALQGALKNYVDSKMIILRQDLNELNKQVFGLITVGQFLPAVFSMSGSSIIY
ncbi:MAG: translocation/assembly module TamB, partial [Saprospiraceae bacterium]|nr:translocation/assembly module TamB [Saprospiraceae bacterium]